MSSLDADVSINTKRNNNNNENTPTNFSQSSTTHVITYTPTTATPTATPLLTIATPGSIKHNHNNHNNHNNNNNGHKKIPFMRIAGFQLGVFSTEQIHAGSVVDVRHAGISDRNSSKYSVNDVAMGVVDRSTRCPVCHNTMIDCPGHPGSIDLWIPIPHPFLVEFLRKVLELVCLCCGSIIFPITPEIRKKLLSLKPKKRLAYAVAKYANNILFCGQIQQHQERLRIDRETKQKELSDKFKLKLAESEEKEKEKQKDSKSAFINESLLNSSSTVSSLGKVKLNVKKKKKNLTSKKKKKFKKNEDGDEGGDDEATSDQDDNDDSDHSTSSTAGGNDSDIDQDDRDQENDDQNQENDNENEKDDIENNEDNADNEDNEDEDGINNNNDLNDDEPDDVDKNNDSSSDEGTVRESDGEGDVSSSGSDADSNADEDNKIADSQFDSSNNDNNNEENNRNDNNDSDSETENENDDQKQNRSVLVNDDTNNNKRKAKTKSVLIPKRNKSSSSSHMNDNKVLSTSTSISSSTVPPVVTPSIKSVKKMKRKTSDSTNPATEPTLTTTSTSIKKEKEKEKEKKIKEKKEKKEKKVGGTPGRRKMGSKSIEGYFDSEHYCRFGCGAPVGEYDRNRLSIHAKFRAVYRGDLSKKNNFPVYNSWRIYEVLRSMPPDQQELLGFDPVHSPIRSLFIQRLLVPPPCVRRKKEDTKKNGSQDDNTQALREVQIRSRKFMNKLKDLGIQTQSDLGSVNQHNFWVLSPPGTPCICPKGRKCGCQAQPREIECVCDEDQPMCRCIPEIYRLHTTTTTTTTSSDTTTTAAANPIPNKITDEKSLEISPKKNPPDVEIIKEKNKRGINKNWRQLLFDTENAVIIYTIGEINKKGAARKDGNSTVSPWMATSGAANATGKKDRAITARFGGKHGRVRGTMYGKRCDKTARTVGSGDLYQRLDEVSVPEEIAQTLTVCEIYQPFNGARLTDRIRSGSVPYVQNKTGTLYSLRFKNRDQYVPALGDTCERHMENGDPLLWNRQPTLHKPSVQGAKSRVTKKRRSLAINHSLTTATNADFDGDEFNVHLSKDEESKCETMGLMSAKMQIRSQQGDSVIIGLVQNARLGLYLLTDPRTRLTAANFRHLLVQFGQVTDDRLVQRMFERGLDVMPAPHDRCDNDPSKNMYTGLQVISALLPIGVFYRTPEPSKKKADDGTNVEIVVIRNSEMLSGRLTGRDVGTGASGNLVHTMVQDIGEEVTICWLTGMQRMANWYLMYVGETMGPGDYILDDDNVKQACDDIVSRARNWCLQHSDGYDMRRNNDKKERLVQSVLERSRNLYLRQLLDVIETRDECVGARRNGIRDLIASVAKGKQTHLMQMGAMVGQQLPLGGRVVANTAHFNRTRHLPEAHGYVASNYRDGLKPCEFFNAAIGGREGLVHTGASVSTVGYFQKRLGSCMSDLHAKADGSIRDSRGGIVQWQYGEDAKDPAYLESNDASEFFTPFEHASPQLKALQLKARESRTRLYEMSGFRPDKWLAPISFKRLIQRATAFNASNTDKNKGYNEVDDVEMKIENSTSSKSNFPTTSVRLTVQQANEKLESWLLLMIQSQILRDVSDPRYDLLLDTLIRDAFSPYHLVQVLGWTNSQFEYVLNLLKISLVRSCLNPGEAVGPTASQSMGEPATQTTLNLFHVAGNQNMLQNPIARLNDTVNACKKPASSGMTVFLQAPWCHDEEAVRYLASILSERRLIDFVLHYKNFQLLDAAEAVKINAINYDSLRTIILPEDEKWFKTGYDLQSSKVQQWFYQWPFVRVQFDVNKAKKFGMHLVELANAVLTCFKQGVGIISSGSYFRDPQTKELVWALYVVVEPVIPLSNSSSTSTNTSNTNNNNNNNATVASMRNSVINQHAKIAAASIPTNPQLQLALVESAVFSCLHDTLIRGLPKVYQSSVIVVDSIRMENGSNSLKCQVVKEHAIATTGSNMEALEEVPWVDFKRCATSYVYDVVKLCGIEGARRWLDENIEELVRACDSRVNNRHTKLIADVMTRLGIITPITRNGLQNSTDSVCRLLFENVLENIKNGGTFAQRDALKGVPESILMGITAPVGTGAVSLCRSVESDEVNENNDNNNNNNNNNYNDLSTTALPTSHSQPQTESHSKKITKPTNPSNQPPLKIRGVRQVPCGARSFRFFQQFVPIGRSGKLAEGGDVVDPWPKNIISNPTIMTSAAHVTKNMTTNTKALLNNENNTKNYNNENLWWSIAGKPVRVSFQNSNCFLFVFCLN
jgi:DNA-directed RNA polymerase beta' subunit